MVKSLPCGRPALSPWVRKIPGGGVAPHSRRIPWPEAPCGLQSMGSQRVRHDEVTKHRTQHRSIKTATGFAEIFF